MFFCDEDAERGGETRAASLPASFVAQHLETGFIGDVLRFLLYLFLLLLFWSALTAGDFAAVWFGLPLTLAGAAIALKLLPARARLWSPAGLLRFVPWFVRESVLGGADVARRALHPRLPLAPSFLAYTTALPEGPARTFLAGLISLLPGTLSAEWRGAELRVHVLDEALAVEDRLRLLERRVADLFGLETNDPT